MQIVFEFALFGLLMAAVLFGCPLYYKSKIKPNSRQDLLIGLIACVLLFTLMVINDPSLRWPAAFFVTIFLYGNVTRYYRAKSPELKNHGIG